jgi:serine/threonine protein kinase
LFTTKEKDKGVGAKDFIVPMFFKEISKILEFFQRTLEFNHRDMKGNNIMYIKNASGKRMIKLIDFGFSCLKWGNMSIRGGDYFKASTTCFRRGRDMAQLMYYALQYFPPISMPLRQYLIEMLKAEVAGEPCSVGEGCIYHGKALVRDYMNAYNFYNRANVVSPFASPTAVFAHMERFERKLPFSATALGTAGSVAVGAAAAGAAGAGVTRGNGAPVHSDSVFIDIAPPAAGARFRGGTRRRKNNNNKRNKCTRYHKK